jgi:hypothetical protein
MATSVSGTFAATGTSAAQNHSGGGLLGLSISGTFVGTIKLERYMGAAWHTIETYTSITEKNVSTASASILYRLNCSAYTSGTVTYYLGYA